MAFALNARRLMDNATSLGKFTDTKLEVVADGSINRSPITRIINAIIHHRRINIIRFNYELKDLSDPKNWTAENVLHKNITYFAPVISMESDQGRRFAFKLWKLVNVFESEVLVPIVDACSEDNLYLDDDL